MYQKLTSIDVIVWVVSIEKPNFNIKQVPKAKSGFSVYSGQSEAASDFLVEVLGSEKFKFIVIKLKIVKTQFNISHER